MARSKSQRATRSLLDSPEVRSARIASVALLRPIDKPYSYAVPDELKGKLRAGMRVAVPFGRGNKPTPAICLEVSDKPWDSTLKSVLSVEEAAPVLDAGLLELGQWIARYYGAPLGRTLDLMVPSAAKRKAGWRRIKYALLPDPRGESPAGLTRRQADVWKALVEAGGCLPVSECAERAGCTAAVVRAIARKGHLKIEERHEAGLPPTNSVAFEEPDFDLNNDQRKAADKIGAAVAQKEFSVPVLFGVTGSGKTEVYISAIRKAISLKRQAIMLVPEIALTTQTVRRLEQRFENVATVHSGLTEVQRSRTWTAIAAGDISVVIGTRSAVFAPCPNLGLIIVDEEAEPSYKSQAAPRYHTRDVAIMRGRILGVPVVLGSATPSLETWSNVNRRAHYELVRLPRRVRGLSMPTVVLVDMRDEQRARSGMHLLSREMETHLKNTLQRGEQAVMLLNRRGYASFLHCAKCRGSIRCPRCAVNMVLHATSGLAHCHYCRQKLVVPTRCHNLGCDGKIIKFGMGTERVEEELALKFPKARVRRIDSDVMQNAEDYRQLIGDFEKREFDVLVGTQMVAKGLDFPFVSLVGVVCADTALALDDFRSEERTFQLVLQVTGRSGRGDAPGVAVVQSFAADTAPIRLAVEGNYENFADMELKRRIEASLPPITRMVRVVLADGNLTKLKSAAEEMVEAMEFLLQRHRISGRVLDPQPSSIPRLRNQYRYDVLLIFETAAALMSALTVFRDERALKSSVRNIVVDVDPVSLQ